MTLSDLISKLEGVTEGSRELDGQIGYALDFTMEGMPITWRQTVDALGWENARWSLMPRWSTSVDAALTLVPDGLEELCVETTTYSNGLSEASLCWGPCEPFNRQSTEGEAKTLPLAICIASLKSRSV